MLIRLFRKFLMHRKIKERATNLMTKQSSQPVMDRVAESNLAQPILAAHPNTQAIFLYGTWGTEYQRRDSDLDIAVLLPHKTARAVDSWAWCGLSVKVARAAKVERADLINLRTAPIILRKEIIAAERRIYCADEYAADEFEMLTLSFYQKFNDERREIVESGLKTGRFYDV